MSWAKKRQLAYIGGFLAFVVLFIVLPGYYFLREEPTCFDGVKNGDETGIDCGGACERVCEFEAADPVINWDESFETRPGVWSVAAYIENPNNAFAENVPYRFRLLDSRGVLVAEREGEAYIPPRQTFVVFESQISVGNRRPTQEFFEFDKEDLEWTRTSGANQPLNIEGVSLEATSTDTKLSAVITNPTTSRQENILVSGIIYDIDGNAISASQTFIEALDSGSARQIIFTWPGTFERDITKREVLYTILPE